VGQAVDQARHEVELTRVALAADIDKLERRIRHELDWKARLRRDGPQIVAIAGAVALVAVGAFLLRARFGGKGAAAADVGEGSPVTLDELAREVRALRQELRGRGKGTAGDDSKPLWQKLAVRGATAGAAAGASMVARRYAHRAQAEPEVSAAGFTSG
jgi:hypothetical protein